MRTHGLEVVELLGVEIREALRFPALGELVASEAPWAPSFHPRNAAIKTGRRRLGRWSMRRCPATRPVYAGSRARRLRTMRTASAATQTQTAVASATWRSTRPQGSPSLLHLSDRHLGEQKGQGGGRKTELDAGPPPFDEEEPEQGEKRDSEDRRRADVHVHRLDGVPKARDLLAARVRSAAVTSVPETTSARAAGTSASAKPSGSRRLLGLRVSHEISRPEHDHYGDRERDGESRK